MIFVLMFLSGVKKNDSNHWLLPASSEPYSIFTNRTVGTELWDIDVWSHHVKYKQ